MWFQLSYFILRDDAVKVLHSVRQQIWKTQQWPQDWKRSFFIPIPKKGNAKECSNYCTIALISQACKVMLKILQALLQQYVNCKLPHSQRLWHSQQSRNRCFFLKLSCFFHDPADVGNLISGSSAFSKTSLNIWKSTVHVLLKPGLENFEHYFTSVWDECNCAIVWAFFGTAFLWDWNENWPFPVL